MNSMIPKDLMINEETLPVISVFAEKLPGGFFIYHAFGDQELIYYNSRLVSIFGCETEEEFRALTGNNFRGIVHPDDYAENEAMILQQIKSSRQEVDHVTYRFIRRDGSVGIMDDYGHFSRSEEFGEIYYVFVQDVTKEHREKQRIAQMELLNRLRNDYEGVFLIDCVNDTRKTFHDTLSGAANYDDSERYSSAFARYVESFVCAPDYAMMKGFADPSALLRSLGDRNDLSVTYRDKTTGTQRFYEMRITRFSETEVLQSFRENDAEVVNELLFGKLKEDYFAIFCVDLESGLLRSYKDDPLHVAGGEGSITTLESTMLRYASFFEGETKAFFERNSDVKQIRQRFAREDRAEFFYRSPLEEGKWTDVTGIVFERRADGTPTLFCLAFNYLDEEAGRLQDMQERLSDALREAREANTRIAEQQLLAGIAEQARKDQIGRIAGTESTYIVDPATGRFQILSQNEHLAQNYPAGEDFDTSFSRYIRTEVFEPDREMVEKAISIPAFVSRLAHEDVYTVRYRDISQGFPRWYEMRSVKLSDSEILYGFSEKDEEITAEIMAENFRESYFGLYYVDLYTGFARVVKTGHPEITGKVGELVPYTGLMKRISSASYGEAAAFFDKISELGYIRDRFASEDHAYHVYKSYIFEGNRWVNYTGRVLKRDKDGAPAVFALAMSLLDEEAAEKEEANLKLEQALSEAESANRAKTGFVNSFKALYQVMYLIDLREGKAEFLYGDEDAKKFLPIFNTDSTEILFENFYRYYVDTVIVPEDRERVKGIMNLPNIYRTLRVKHRISVNYQVRRNLVDPVYTEMSMIRFAEQDGELSAVILAFRMTDEELRTALDTRRKLEADARIIGALSEDFSCVDYVVIGDRRENDRSIGVRTSGLLRRYIPEWETAASFTEKTDLFCERLVCGPDRELFRQSMRRGAVLERLGGTDTYYFNIRLLADGVLRYYQVKISAVREGGKLIGVVFGTRSVDENTRRDLETRRQLREALDRAESASRAKTEFLFNMSHDIRTPMNAILGFTGMARKHLDDRARTADLLGKIDSSGKQLLELINQVLEMSRIESGKTEVSEIPVNVTGQFGASVTVLAEQARDKGLEFHYSLSDAVHLNVFADTAKMSSITMNITGNAMKYTPAGGRIDYSLREIPARRPGYATYVFTVADTGIGMGREFLEKLYEPFTREQNSTVSRIQGTGLGLSIVKKLVDLLGGSIDVVSEPGKGTRFDITLDLRINETVKEKTGAKKKTQEISFAGRKALIVEDNEMNRDIAADLLGEEGLITETAADGSIAVKMLAEKGTDFFDIILMDIQMPVMNGYEATRAIRAMPGGDRIPIIALSANAFEEDRQRSLAEGMDAHIAKPIDVKLLFETIRSMFGAEESPAGLSSGPRKV